MPTNLKEKSLEDWVNKYAADMLTWAIHKVSNTELAKDLVQDTFMAAFDIFDSFWGDSSPNSWLLCILNFKIIDDFRS